MCEICFTERLFCCCVCQVSVQFRFDGIHESVSGFALFTPTEIYWINKQKELTDSRFLIIDSRHEGVEQKRKTMMMMRIWWAKKVFPLEYE